MYEQLFGNVNAQLSNLTAPAQRFNAAVVDHLEKLAQFQLEAAKTYADLGVEQLRSALTVNDAESLQAYVSSQGKVANTVSKKLAEDANTLTGLNKDFAQEIQQLAQENLSVFSAEAQQKKAARSTARKSA